MTEKIRLDYQMFRWGPLLFKFKIPDDISNKFFLYSNLEKENLQF